jgi:hypothetical protein
MSSELSAKGATMQYEEVVNGMRNRMRVSRHKYGPLDESMRVGDYIESMYVRVKKYEATGNTEWLMDAANFLIIEVMYPSHEKAHFRATDSNESPGYVTIFGTSEVRPTQEILADAKKGLI